MKVAVLSGKGGTGKTIVSVNLASLYNNAVYADCDVEEPNGHLFFKPTQIEKSEVTVQIPLIDNNKCIGCKACVDFCNFNALAFTSQVILFDVICHSCGGCKLVCPTQAISEVDKVIGYIQSGYSNEIKVIGGRMNTGEASGVPIINKIIDSIKEEKNVFVDCPPGSACVVMESIKDADYCVLVAEPTLFGCHNLKMVHELVKLFNKKFGVVLNKCTADYNPSEEFCNNEGIVILAKIPFDKQLGTINSYGKIAVREEKKYYELFKHLYQKIVKEIQQNEANINS